MDDSFNFIFNMRVLTALALLSVVYGESPAPYLSSGWKPQGQPFNLPSNQQQFSQQYNAPQRKQPYNTIQFSQQYNSANLNQQYGTPEVNQQYGTPLTTQYLPSEQSARNFGGYNSNFNQVSPNYNAPLYQNNPTQYSPEISSINKQNTQTPQHYNSNINRRTNFNNRNHNLNSQQREQFGKLVSQNSQFEFDRNAFRANQNFQNVESFNNERQNGDKPKDINNSEELDGNQENEFSSSQQSENSNGNEYIPEKEYRPTVTTTKRPIKTTKRPERTTQKPQTTTEEAEENFDNPNIAISTAVAGKSVTGQYYILQADGRLQRVVYMTSPDPKDEKNAAVIANLMYETVEPLKGPIYQYVGSQLVRIN